MRRSLVIGQAELLQWADHGALQPQALSFLVELIDQRRSLGKQRLEPRPWAHRTAKGKLAKDGSAALSTDRRPENAGARHGADARDPSASPARTTFERLHQRMLPFQRFVSRRTSKNSKS
jgi:hypothetical protein